jgi:hypothetical protein
MLRFFLALLMGLLLVGCAHDKEIVIQTKPIFPPNNLLQDCPVEAPPSREVYKAAGVDTTREQAAAKREELLMEFGGKQTKNVGKCNADKKGLREWKAQQEKIYNKDAEGQSKKKD